MEYVLKDISDEEANEELFDSYIDYLDLLFMELHPRDPLPPKEYSKNRFRLKIPGQKGFRTILLIDNTICAHYYMMIRTKENPEYEKNKKIVDLFISVLKDHEFNSLANILLEEAIEKLKEYDVIETIETCCYRDRVKNYWEDLGAKIAIEGGQNRLYLEDVDWEMIEQWRIDGHKRAKDEEINLISYTKCPENILEDYSRLYTEIMKLVPFGDFEWQPEDITPKKVRETEERFDGLGYKWHTMITQESSGELSGITEIFYHPARSHQVEQELTGVALNFRGRGLGKWLKAEMLDFVKNEYPEVKFFITGNSDTNAPMLSINERMGFKTYLEEKCFTIKIKDIII